MTYNFSKYLDQIDSKHDEMQKLLVKWAEINSGSRNLEGLALMLSELKSEFSKLESLGTKLEINEIKANPLESIDSNGEKTSSPLGSVLSIRVRPEAKLKVLLGGHMDTVFPVDSHFQKTEMLDENTMQGPGVSDLKGGLVVMLKTLESLEAFLAESELRDEIGWELFVNADEEIGSPGSSQAISEAAKRNDLGLIFEPTLRDGTLVTERFGTGNFTIVFKGKAAHVGREFQMGQSALVAAAHFIKEIDQINNRNEAMPNLIVNVGKVEGGEALNAVPDLAICRLNVRIKSIDDEKVFFNALEEAKKKTLESLKSIYQSGISIESHGHFNRKPKELSEGTKKLLDLVTRAGEELKLEIKSKATGGCCDGNNFAEHGLVNIDTMGVRGANIHSDKEYILLDSLTERAKLASLLLMKLATGDYSWQ